MKKQSVFLLAAAVLCALSLAVMAAALAFGKPDDTAVFVPPTFDASAVKGEPDVPDGVDIIEPYTEGMTFRASVIGMAEVRGSEAYVYFANKAENDVWLLLRIMDEQGSVLAQSGLVRPGEYVKTVAFTSVPADGQRIVYKVMAYEPETYYSKGHFELKTFACVCE